MQTTGLCVHRDLLCEKVSHPLSYYKAKKSRITKKFVPENKKPETSKDTAPPLKEKIRIFVFQVIFSLTIYPAPERNRIKTIMAIR